MRLTLVLLVLAVHYHVILLLDALVLLHQSLLFISFLVLILVDLNVLLCKYGLACRELPLGLLFFLAIVTKQGVPLNSESI